MQEQKFGIRRSRETTKPKAVTPEVAFYRCTNCHRIFQSITGMGDCRPSCCDMKMEELQPKNPSELPKSFINYQIIGGYNENAIEVTWEQIEAEDAIEWIYLKTFTGGQLKFVTNPRKTSFIFALADEDAYVYCDENPCLECTFRCKRGFEIYGYSKGHGLIKIAIDRMQASW